MNSLYASPPTINRPTSLLPILTMDSFSDFCHHARIVNRMFTMHSTEALSLPRLLPLLPRARYNRARPCRIYWRFEDRIPVQLFPKGTVQVLGKLATHESCEAIRQCLMTKLSITLSQPHLSSCTVTCRLAARISRLTSLPSNQHVSNDYELFPGTLIRPSKSPNQHAHLCFFSNGHVIVTGVTSLRQAYRHVKRCLHEHDLKY